MQRHGDPGWHICIKCQMVNRHNAPDPTQTIQEELYVRHFNGREYRLIIDYGANKCLLYEWSPGRKDLLNIDHMINVTPSTVDNKIKTYLLFL